MPDMVKRLSYRRILSPRAHGVCNSVTAGRGTRPGNLLVDVHHHKSQERSREISQALREAKCPLLVAFSAEFDTARVLEKIISEVDGTNLEFWA